VKLSGENTGQGGFTLIEMIVSAGLMGVILSSAYMCLSAGVASKKLIEARSDATQSARVALALIAADLRMAVPMTGDFEFVGMRRVVGGADADNIDFSTRNYTPRNSREPDYCEVSYYLEKDPDADSFILIRRRDATPDPEPMAGGSREEIARGVRGFRIQYYDGIEWWTEWGDPEGKTKGMMYPPLNSYGLPEAVSITLEFDPEGPKKKLEGEATEEETKALLTFETTARLTLAPYFALQSKSSSSSTSQEQSATAPAEGVPE
jgi:prepilin-type N-terminal cleavage/methylation domain-containing protein